MRRTAVCVLVILLIVISGSVLAAERKHGVGIGLASSEVEAFGTDIDFTGFTLFGKYGITEGDLPGIVKATGKKATPIDLSDEDLLEILSARL